MNRPWLLVHRRPRVAILPTGDEVVMPGDPVGPNQIVCSNGIALAALVTACGGVPVHLAIAPDDNSALQRIAAGAAGADLLLTTGGASVGDHDLVRGALGASGLTLDFWTVAMRPGKPLMVGRYQDTPMIGLPGNPVSTLVCGLLFAKPAMAKMSGIAEVFEAPTRARLKIPLDANDRRQDYLRATLEPRRRRRARSRALQEAGQLDDLASGRAPIASSSARPTRRRPKPAIGSRSSSSPRSEIATTERISRRRKGA